VHKFIKQKHVNGSFHVRI